jgi:hypothetical protein
MRSILANRVTDENAKWFTLIAACFALFMAILDNLVVNVALPTIRDDLGFSQTSLAWVVNAYLLTFGGFLLLGGRLGDLFGHRRLFLSGISLFTAASLACGLATSQGVLIAARAVQGMGGAVVSAVALSLLMMLFTEPADRAKALLRDGFGSMLSIDLHGGRDAVEHVVQHLEMIRFVETLGGLGTTVVHPATTSHRSVDAETRRELEIGDGLLRFSIGIEEPEDLIEEVTTALDAVKK